MDIQTIPAHEVVQTENQASVDAMRRMVTTRDALTRLYEAQPSLDEANTEGVQTLLDALSGFWASPETAGGESRRAVLGRHLASVMKEQATLRRLDGTLAEDAASLAARATAASSDLLPAGMHARELMLGNVAHAGSLIVVDDGSPGVALLFTAHGGWEAFDSLDRLLESTRRRLLESVDVTDGTGIEDDYFAEAKLDGTVGSREIAGLVFDALASRMIEVQRGSIALAADDYDLDIDEPDAETQLGDRVHFELSPAALLDIEAIEQLREARLLEAAVARRLALAPRKVSAAWYEARDAYNDALAAAAVVRTAAGLRPPLTLRDFASRELAARLAALGIDMPPEAITIEVARIKTLPEPLAFLDPLPGPAKARRIPLVDFASQNIGRFSLESLHAMDAEGTSLRDRLGHGAIRDMVRDLDLTNRYQTHVEQRLRHGAKGALARKLAVVVQAAQMRLEAAEARLSYYLSDEPRSFIDDRDERGFRWVDAALDARSVPRHVGGHEIVVSQLTYRQVPLDGLLIFAARASGSAPRLVMYTPDAPDGLTFREFDSRQEAAKRFLYHPAFREYLLDRLPAEFAKVLPNGVTRRFDGDHLAHWVLGASSTDSYTPTAEPFDQREVQGDFVAAVHDATVEKHRRNTRFLARSTADADSDALLGIVQAQLDARRGMRLLADAIAEVPMSLARMMQASWRFYDHVKAGDTGLAVVAFADGYVNALNLVTPPFVGGRHFAGAIVRSRSATHGVARTGIRLTPARTPFDDRYAARSLGKSVKPDEEGIFRVRGQSYIKQDETFFLVRYDQDYGRWRLAPPRGAMDARFTGPVIERIDDRWTYANDVGLRGGMRRLRRRLNRLVVRDHAPAPTAPAPDGIQAADPVPVASPPMPLPAVMEPFRAEITAVLADNPSASVLVRGDGTGLKFSVPRRSALILDSPLHPDIAELSAHQRRVFLHELDNRFPLRAERAEVLNTQGWAQHDGRRVPSPPSSPGATPDADIQSPSISSSTNDPTTRSPILTPSQQARWDEALTLARNTPRSPPRTPRASIGDTVTETLPATEVVPLAEWPDRMWYFSETRFEAEFWPGSSREGVTLGDASNWLGHADGVHTQTVTALPPETPLNRLSESVGTSPTHQIGQRDPLGYAMQIDMGRLRDALAWGIAHNTQRWQPGFEMRRRLLSNGEYQYVLQSTQPIRIHSAYILGVGRRGELLAPLPSIRH
jgi:hypothetical protein